jgi:hypothetical protein
MNIKETITSFFVENDFDKISQHISLVRKDGIVIYSNEGDSFKSSSLGALSGGLWQAAKSMMNYIGDNEEQQFRLSFDTSSSGLFILPITVGNSECYLVSIYQDALNPAKIKQQLKNLVFLLEMYIRDESFGVSSESTIEKNNNEREGYLFSDISDEEIDRMFGVIV